MYQNEDLKRKSRKLPSLWLCKNLKVLAKNSIAWSAEGILHSNWLTAMTYQLPLEKGRLGLFLSWMFIFCKKNKMIPRLILEILLIKKFYNLINWLPSLLTLFQKGSLNLFPFRIFKQKNNYSVKNSRDIHGSKDPAI